MLIRTTYRITSLSQWTSADAVTTRLSALPGIRGVRVDIVAGTALVTSDAPPDRDAVRAAVVEAGHDLAPERRMGLGPYLGGVTVALVAGFALGHTTAGTPAGGGGAGAAATATPHPHPSGASAVAGLSISDRGYTLAPGPGAGLSFVVRDARGTAVTRFATVHDRQMHVVVVRRDLTGYQHLHPTMAADGTWTAPLTLPEPGPWRAYADFTVFEASGATVPLALGYDLVAPGDYRPRALPPPATTATVDGLTVTFSGGPGYDFRVGPAAELQPYLGSYGHLVVLRVGDLAYVHVHPEPKLVNGAVRFSLSVPSSGTYRMYFDFQVAGQVRTAEFTLTAP